MKEEWIIDWFQDASMAEQTRMIEDIIDVLYPRALPGVIEYARYQMKRNTRLTRALEDEEE